MMIGDVVMLSPGGFEAVVLWENASPRASFAPQTISLQDMTQFTFIGVEIWGSQFYSGNRDLEGSTTVYAFPNGELYEAFFGNAYNGYSGHRLFTVNQSSIEFQNATYRNSTDNTVCIPETIFGIR